jgi:V/A-type H+/Na+-transporting ATPase subunit I
MFVKSDIRKITIAFEKAFYHEVYLALGQAGLIHLARFQERDSVTDTGLQGEETLIREIISASTYALNALHIEADEAGGEAMLVHAVEDEAFVSSAKKKLERIARLQAKIREARDILDRDIQYAEALNRMGIDPGMLTKTRIIQTVFGTVENVAWDVPPYERFIISRTGRYIFGMALPKYFADMMQFLKEIGFADKSDEVCQIPLEMLKKRADALQRRDEALDEYGRRLKKEKGEALQKINRDYKAYEKMLKAMRMSVFSSRAMFITGWMDARERTRLIGIMQTICGNKFVVSERKEPDAPVRLMNMRLFRPFELLVKTMGMPSNSEIDPTPLAAITFVLMFGLMFGDLGQGLVLVMAGLLLRKIGRKKIREELAQAGGIIMACGGSAAVCGLLYGSVFSSEHLLPALWFHPSAEIMRLFFITILMGAVFILIGFCLNIINSIINSDYTEALLEKRGLVVLVLYAAIVVFALNYQRTGQSPALWAISVFIFLPLIIFSLRGVLGSVFFQKAKPHRISEYIIETVMEIVEIALSLFANTISFIRVGAFALSHAGLSIVTYTLAGMADPAIKSVGAVAIIVIGNIFIIGFEGLICGIQSMRLEYYEFFSKFFKGEGVAFSPFTLKAKTSEV